MFRKRHLEPEDMPFTETMLANMRPFGEMFPELAAADEAERRAIGCPPKLIQLSI